MGIKGIMNILAVPNIKISLMGPEAGLPCRIIGLNDLCIGRALKARHYKGKCQLIVIYLIIVIQVIFLEINIRIRFLYSFFHRHDHMIAAHHTLNVICAWIDICPSLMGYIQCHMDYTVIFPVKEIFFRIDAGGYLAVLLRRDKGEFPVGHSLIIIRQIMLALIYEIMPGIVFSVPHIIKAHHYGDHRHCGNIPALSLCKTCPVTSYTA